MSVTNLKREETFAVGALFLVLVACIAAPVTFLKMRSDTLQQFEEEHDVLTRLEAAHQRRAGKAGGRDQFAAAPAAAFLNAQTSGLASAQLEAYLSQLVVTERASLSSSAVQPSNRADAAEVVRIQAILEVNYEALQTILYKLETGMPYVFIDSMTVQTPAAQHGGSAAMKVTLILRALWHKTSS